MFMVPYILVIYIYTYIYIYIYIYTSIYIFDRLQVRRDAHGFLCIFYYTILALHVSVAICTHHQEHKLQSTAVGTRECFGVLEAG
jgi:hypothetical protein